MSRKTNFWDVVIALATSKRLKRASEQRIALWGLLALCALRLAMPLLWFVALATF